MDTIEIRSIEKIKTNKVRVRGRVLFNLKMEIFSVRDSSIVTLYLKKFYESLCIYLIREMKYKT